MWRCLIIEDDRANARYIADGLSELGHWPVVCNDGSSGLERAIGEPWDIIVLDRMLPNDIDGLSIVETLRNLGKKTPVLVLSALTALDERVRGLKSGGDDYLTKPFAFLELSARLEALIRRSAVDTKLTRSLQVGGLRLDLVARQATRDGQNIVLSPREFRLLAYMMMHQGQVLTRTMLLGAVWDYHFNPQTNVIDVHISRLRQKVDGGHTQQLIHTVRGAGYKLSLETPVTTHDA